MGEPVAVAKRADFDAVTAALTADIVAMLHEAQRCYPVLTGGELAFLPARLGGSAPTPEEAARLDDRDVLRRAVE